VDSFSKVRSLVYVLLQIRYLLVQNRQGRTRLSKWYVPYEDDEKRQLQFEVHRVVNSREARFTNFVEFRQHKVVYRRYAGLYFCVCCDPTDNDLALLEAIHLFVEVLDSYFGNVVGISWCVWMFSSIFFSHLPLSVS
jgi:AP-2 complex subunit sigma-1